MAPDWTWEDRGRPSITVFPRSCIHEVFDMGLALESRRDSVRLLVSPSSGSKKVSSWMANWKGWPSFNSMVPIGLSSSGGLFCMGDEDGVGEEREEIDGEGVGVWERRTDREDMEGVGEAEGDGEGVGESEGDGEGVGESGGERNKEGDEVEVGVGEAVRTGNDRELKLGGGDGDKGVEDGEREMLEVDNGMDTIAEL